MLPDFASGHLTGHWQAEQENLIFDKLAFALPMVSSPEVLEVPVGPKIITTQRIVNFKRGKSGMPENRIAGESFGLSGNG